MPENENENKLDRIAAGVNAWHQSKYNIFAPIPGTNQFVGINLLHGTCATYSKAELYLLSEVEFLHEGHPVMERFVRDGFAVNYDELQALDCIGKLSTTAPNSVCIGISPTMGCNFDCPYCFLEHWNSRMTEEVQDDVIGLAERMLDASNVKQLRIRWFGGEPLLAPDIIESLSKRLMKLAEERGAEYKAWMYTNGYLLTQEIADMLGECKVDRLVITVDGLEKTHNATRPLAGGGPTFERIISNLRDLKLPFRVDVRQNLHAENIAESGELRKLVEDIAEESGNRLNFVRMTVKFSNIVRSDPDVKRLTDEEYLKLDTERIAEDFGPSTGIYCDAGNIWSVGVNSEGRLFRCWEKQDDKKYSFGSAKTWNPRNPIRTADQPDLFTAFINNAVSTDKKECRECRWLPLCLGTCPFYRMETGEKCIPWKDNSDEYVLAVYRVMLKRAKEKEEKDEQGLERGNC